jgi:hypothetical protein
MTMPLYGLVQVFPNIRSRRPEDNADQQKIKKERSLEDILKALFDENLILELNDEYALLDGLVANQNEKLKRTKCREHSSGYFPRICGALMCSAPASNLNTQAACQESTRLLLHQKISEAVFCR